MALPMIYDHKPPYFCMDVLAMLYPNRYDCASCCATIWLRPKNFKDLLRLVLYRQVRREIETCSSKFEVSAIMNCIVYLSSLAIYGPDG